MEAPQNGTKRSDDGRFVKGNCTNPGGRPRLPEEIKMSLRHLSLEAVEVLADLMRNSESDMVRARAAETILDRAWGRPAQNIHHSGEHGGPIEHDVLDLRSDANRSLYDQLLAASAGADDSSVLPGGSRGLR